MIIICKIKGRSYKTNLLHVPFLFKDSGSYACFLYFFLHLWWFIVFCGQSGMK